MFFTNPGSIHKVKNISPQQMTSTTERNQGET